jgi:hypothetical protein
MMKLNKKYFRSFIIIFVIITGYNCTNLNKKEKISEIYKSGLETQITKIRSLFGEEALSEDLDFQISWIRFESDEKVMLKDNLKYKKVNSESIRNWLISRVRNAG